MKWLLPTSMYRSLHRGNKENHAKLRHNLRNSYLGLVVLEYFLDRTIKLVLRLFGNKSKLQGDQ
jgi:hypothetical protein